MSSGKSSGQPPRDIETIGPATADASSSRAPDVVRTADARTSATSRAQAASSSALPSWWIGAVGTHLRPLVGLLGLCVALFLGFAAGFVPAWGAYRARITDMLRTV